MIIEELFAKALAQDTFLHGRLTVLNKFGVVGCKYRDECRKLATFLTENEVDFSKKGDYLIYLNPLPTTQLTTT